MGWALMEVVSDAETLCEALSLAIDSGAGIPSDDDERVLDRQALAVKCLFHAASCLALANGTHTRTGVVLDLGSINVLVRSTLESALVFHHLFVSPQSPEQAEFRHLSWVLADTLERLEFPATLPDSLEIQRDEREQADRITARIKGGGEFRKLTPKQQKALLEDGRWSPGWAKLARTAGLSELHATNVHRFLCSYSHSGSLSVMQTRAPKTRDEQERLLSASLQLVSVSLALMTSAYCSVLPQGREALRDQLGLASKVEEWVRIGGGAPVS
jgi:hypothetical protein